MTVYAESSAVLAWLLGEPDGGAAREALVGADSIVASELTLVECERVLVRAVATARIEEAVAADRHAHLENAATHWITTAVDEPVLERARRPFPHEPLRTLDALHLASAIEARRAIPGLELLSLDERIRRAGGGLGFEIRPR